MTDRTTLEEELREVAGEAYGKGMAAEEVVAALQTIERRFKRLAEVEE